MAPCPTTHHGATRGIDKQALSVVEILVPGQAAEEGLSEERHEAEAAAGLGSERLGWAVTPPGVPVMTAGNERKSWRTRGLCACPVPYPGVHLGNPD
jgi:hypothetical protein